MRCFSHCSALLSFFSAHNGSASLFRHGPGGHSRAAPRSLGQPLGASSNAGGHSASGATWANRLCHRCVTQAYKIRAITDYNEVVFHPLEVIFAHQMLEKTRAGALWRRLH